MFGIHQNTIYTKLFILVSQVIEMNIAGIITHSAGWSNISIVVIWTMIGITFLRLNAMMFIWLPRGISWREAIGNSLAFGLYYIVFPMLVRSEIYTPILILGILLFVIGGVINTTAELLRRPFKANPKNKGRLYTGGLFHYAVHINYFGDVLWVLGFALCTMNPWALVIPALLLLFFVTNYIPTANRYLRKKYGKEFVTYEANTKQLIPWVW